MSKKTTSILDRKQKAFRMAGLYPVDANNLDVDEAMVRLLILLRTGGRHIRKTNKPVFLSDDERAETPGFVLETSLEENAGVWSGTQETGRRALLELWLESHFAIMTRQGKTRGGDFRMAGLRPLHFLVIRLYNPRVRSQDRYLSDFFYQALASTNLAQGSNSLLDAFFAPGVKRKGSNDYELNEGEIDRLAKAGQLDIELLFLLRLLQPFEADMPDLKTGVGSGGEWDFLCREQIELMQDDLRLLFLYRDKIPRREFIAYMTSLLVLHASLYFYQTVRIANYAASHGRLPPPRGTKPKPGAAGAHTPFALDIFCDLTGGQNEAVVELARERFTAHFKEVERYFKSAYTLKKLEEFASTWLTTEQKKLRGAPYLEAVLEHRESPDLNGHFNRDLQTIIEAGRDEDGQEHPDIARIVAAGNERGASRFEVFVDVVCFFQYGTLREQHRKLLSALCSVDMERGFLAGRGRARKRYVLGNELLEVLIQLAVLEQRKSDGKWQSRPIPIREFVDWLRARYGFLIDDAGEGQVEDEALNRALAANYDAFKTRLQQLGFFVDLSDASNSQVIRPRFPIHGESLDPNSPATAASSSQ